MEKGHSEQNTVFRPDKNQALSIHTLFDSYLESVFLIDTVGIILDANKTFALRIGKSLQECLGKNVYEFLSPELAAQRRKKIDEILCTGKMLSFEDERNECWIRNTISPYRSPEGEINSLLIIAEDITERKHIELTLKNEQTFNQVIIDAIPGIFCMVDGDARLTAWNPYLRDEIVGKLDEEMQGTDMMAYINHDDHPLIREKIKNVLLSGIEETAEARVLQYGGQEIKWLLLKGRRIIINDQPFVIVIGSDITDRKLAEQALHESEKKFRSITEQMCELVFVTNANGQITYISPTVEKVMGYKPEEAIGHIFTEYLADEEIPRAVEIFTDAISHQLTNQVLEFKYKKKNGSIFDAEIHSQFFKDDETSGVIGLLRDISDRKKTETIRKEYEQKLLESRQFLQSIYNDVNHSIIVVDVLPDGSYRYKGNNALHAKLTGISQEKIIGKTPEEVLDPEIAKFVTGNYDACIREGKTIQFEECLPFLGKEMWWETVLNPVRNESGHIYRIIGTITNITERKLAENQLIKLSAAVEQSPAVVVITDPLGNIEYVNPMFTQLTGYSVKEVRGRNPRILQSGFLPKSVYEDLWQTILSGNIWRGEFQNRKKNGELFWETAVIAAILDKKGEITNFVAVKEDITEQKRYLNELIASKERAEESDRLKSAFLANISHEIRTPMNGILGFSELLKEPHLSGEEQSEFIDLIQRSGERMLNLINDLIDISRIEAGETILQISETPVNKLLYDLKDFFQTEADKKGLSLSCTTGLSDNESIIETDYLKLNQILTNLVQNALKFTTSGGVDVGYTKQDNILEFYVIDTGIGIPDDMTEKIFERFRQVNNSLTRHHEGAGLGLSISMAYVTMLGGSIRVESEAGKGSKFIFQLPYNPPCLSKTEPLSVATEEHAVYTSDLTVLIAEDDTVSRLVLEMFLKSENITILSAVNGQEAVEMVEHHPEINLVLMDIKMPVMNGFEATRLIKRLRPELPVIAQTAFTSKKEMEKSSEVGFDRIVAKPVKKNELLKIMNELLKQ